MRKYYFCLLLFLLTTATKTLAQLTIFNVSSSDITDARKISIQQQFEIQDIIHSSTTLTYGLGKQWEAGFNLYNVDYSTKTKHIEINDTTTASPYAPLLLLNVQKVVQLTNILAVGIGAVGGKNLTRKRASKYVYYAYSNLAATIQNGRFQLAAGPYIGNHRYLSDGPTYGFQSGFDAGIWNKKVHVLGDWISGSHQKGQLTLGLEFFLTENLPLSVGWQRSNQDGSQGVVLQLTYAP